jgi:hypothetical protein
MATPRNKRIVKINAYSYAHLIKLLLDGIYTCEELAQETGLHYVTVLHYCRELYRAKAVHIGSWGMDRTGRDSLKIYKIGAGRDAQRRRMTRAEIARRYRSKRQSQMLNHLMAGALHASTL